jgi:hypothetical protein
MRVHLDHRQPTLAQVKVVAEEEAQRPARAEAGDRGRSSQHMLSVSWKCHYRFNGLYHLRHALQLRRRHEYGLRCKEERAALSNHPGKAGLAQFPIKGARQGRLVETDAEARTIELVDRAAWQVNWR